MLIGDFPTGLRSLNHTKKRNPRCASTSRGILSITNLLAAQYSYLTIIIFFVNTRALPEPSSAVSL